MIYHVHEAFAVATPRPTPTLLAGFGGQAVPFPGFSAVGEGFLEVMGDDEWLIMMIGDV